MSDYSQLIGEEVMKRIDSLSWKCGGCPKIRQCEEQHEGGESRYCMPLITAALLGQSDFETAHREGLPPTKLLTMDSPRRERVNG